MRQIIAIALLLFPAIASAQTISTFRWMNFLFGVGADEGARTFAIEVHGLIDVNLRPPPPLTRPGWWLRPGGEVRAFVGVPGTGYELFANLGWLVSDPSRKGTMRPGFGLSYNIPTGGGSMIYGMLSGGLWMNLDGAADAWGPSVAAETRLAFGARFRVTSVLAMVTEFNVTTLAVGAGNFEPFVGLRLGWAISPPDPEREERLRLRRELLKR